ncbi:MAG: hypothetical protein PHW53_04960 [Patescibacteria group bacterium]|nr:hypothetical protein [Patescibacteria group bacterium]
MLASSLITTIREDYLNDATAEYLWSDANLLRKLTEAERQSCNRADLIYDDSTTAYTRITLVNGQASYNIDPIVTVVENIIFDNNYVIKKAKEDMDAISATWRTDSGMAGKTVYAVISGRKLRISPVPDATDAGGYVYLETYRLPADAITSTSQEPEIPEENHRDLIYWMLHECYKKQDADTFNQEKSDYYLARFNQIFGEPVSAKVRQHQFESPRSLILGPASYTKTISTGVDDDNW